MAAPLLLTGPGPLRPVTGVQRRHRFAPSVTHRRPVSAAAACVLCFYQDTAALASSSARPLAFLAGWSSHCIAWSRRGQVPRSPTGAHLLAVPGTVAHLLPLLRGRGRPATSARVDSLASPVAAPWTRAQPSFPAPFLARRTSPTLPEPRVQAPSTPPGPAAAAKSAYCGLSFLYPVRCLSLPCFAKPSSPAKASSSRRISPPHHVPGAAAPARPQVHRREHPTSPLPTRGPRPCSSALCSERARAR